VRVRVEAAGSTVSFGFEPHPGDRIEMKRPDGSLQYRLARPDCRFYLPEGFLLEECHPDLIAAVAVSICAAFGLERL
jgi:hypothetical protein